MADASCTARLSGDRTTGYYDRNANEYVNATAGVDMTAVYDRFLKHVPPPATILDAGCGSGRDILAFVDRGYSVEAFDASPALCKLATGRTGVSVKVLRFQDLDVLSRYDGIWACASLLHVPEAELDDSFSRLFDALKPGGGMYASLKKGVGERQAADGRLFLDMDENRLRAHLARFPEMTVADLWLSDGEGSHKGKADWLNVIAIKDRKVVTRGA